MFWVSWLFVRKRRQQLFRNTASSNRFSCCTKLTGTQKENTTSKSSKLFPQGSTIWIFNWYHSNNVNVVNEYLLHKVKACQLPPSFWYFVILWNLSKELKCPRNFLDRKCSYFTLTSWHVPICKKVLLMSNFYFLFLQFLLHTILLCLCNSALLCQKGWLVKKKNLSVNTLKITWRTHDISDVFCHWR